MWQNIPNEVRELPQWVAAGPNKIPINPRTGQTASPTDPGTWGTFDEAVRAGFKHIGFVLTDHDPYTIIDLDNKVDKPLAQEQWAVHQRILETINSYTERSASGRGYHIIVRGKIPHGLHRDSVEVYSSARYMICTGNVVRQVPIADYQPVLDQLYKEMNNVVHGVSLDDVPDSEVIDDGALVEMASNATNGEKFDALCAGQWQELGYPSQSEADFALLSMLAFYSRNNEQVRRLFRYSRLGQREKALRNDDYLNRCLAKIRANLPTEINFDALKQEVAATLASTAGVPNPPPLPAKPPITKNSTDSTPRLPPPPGLVGEIASYFFQTAVRPVHDIAVCAAIGFVAGIAGRSYHISNTGLNQYIIILAKTGTGKESATGGIENLMSAVRRSVPSVDQFIGPSAFASGQSLIRVLDERPCFVSVLGEFGLTLQQLCSPDASSAQIMLRKVLLDLYTKSGPNAILRSTVYADVEKNTRMIQSPAVTLLAESTPETFYDGLEPAHIAEGLIPRFSIVEFHGNRPPRNRNAHSPPPTDLVDKVTEIATRALSMQSNNVFMPVAVDPRAEALLDAFDKEADAMVDEGSEVDRQLWTRAHLKALKLGGVLAVGISPDSPKITVDLAEWAVEFIRREIVAVSTRFKTGDIGTGENKLVYEVRRVIKEYLHSDYQKVEKYQVEEKFFVDKMIPWSYIQRRTANLSSFRRHKGGATGALSIALNTLIDSGLIMELPKKLVWEKYKSHTRVISVLPEFATYKG